MEEKFVITEITRVIMVGKDEYTEAKTSFSPHLESNEIVFHFSGHSTVYFGDCVLHIKPNTIRFLPEGDGKRYVVERREGGECILVCFRADRPISESAFVFDASKKEKIAHLFKKLFSLWVGRGAGYYMEAVSLLYKIFAEMQREQFSPKQHFDRIKPAVDYIHENFLYESLSVEKLASLCGIGDSYFQRLFKEKYSVPPLRYINQLKIHHACELLRLERYSVSQIAELSNFSSVYFFSRQFKEYMGIAPSAFVRKYKSSK